MDFQKSSVVQSYGHSENGLFVSRAMAAAAANKYHSNRTKEYSVSVYYSMAAEQDAEVDDELSSTQNHLRDLKTKISTQSKKNFMLERDVRYLDARIGLLIHNRMALEEQHEVASRLEDNDDQDSGNYLDEHRMQQYGNLFYLLQNEPRHIAILCRLITLNEMDTLLQTVMFTLYGNQYESREEHLLLTMFQNVLTAQFETATEFSSLLRANTPVSRMMTTYTRRGPGQSYLKYVLSEKINCLLEHKDLNLQINPLKVYEEYVAKLEQEQGQLPDGFPKSVTAEIAAANSNVQDIILPRLKTLMDLANSFLSTIIQSLDQVPYGIRWICKQIRSLTKRKYPDASEYTISSLIGGFFFLRFINPAIVTPQAYMLVDTAPGQNLRTILTLVAKLLQNLANKPSYSKETYMQPTNPFVDFNKQRTNKFLNDLCEVSDFYEQLEIDQYMALCKKNTMISITPNEVYNTLSLLQQHIDIIAPKDTDHLRLLVNEIGPAPAQVPRNENKPVDLPLVSRWEVPIQDLITRSLMSENDITQNEILYMETKLIFVQILRLLPRSTKPLLLDVIAETAATSKNTQLVHKGIKVKEMLRELQEANVISRKDNYRILVEEIRHELKHLGDLKVKIVKELESLQSVYKLIIEHNNYLKSQLESYKAYLQNVKIQIGSEKINSKIVDNSTSKQKKSTPQGPFIYTHQQLEEEGIIVQTKVPEQKRQYVSLAITLPIPDTFSISIYYQGKDEPLLEVDLKLDTLFERQTDSIQTLDLEYVYLSVAKTLQLLTTTFQINNN